MTEAFGRLFGTWTLITCMLCAICAFNIHNEAIYGACLVGPEGRDDTYIVHTFACSMCGRAYCCYHSMGLRETSTICVMSVMRGGRVAAWGGIYSVMLCVTSSVCAAAVVSLG